MSQQTTVRHTLGAFTLDDRDVLVYQCDGDAYDLARLAYADEPALPLGRVTGLGTPRPHLAAVPAPWTPDRRASVRSAVQTVWRHFELEALT